MWELLVRANPNLIKRYNGNKESVFLTAIKKGYIPTKEDLNKENFCCSYNVIEYLIKEDCNLIKYYRKNDETKYITKLIDDAISMGYIPNYDDLLLNGDLGYNKNLIVNLIENGYPDAIKYYKVYHLRNNDDIFDLAIEKGYKPSLDDIKNNTNLANSLTILKLLVPQYPECVRYIKGGFGNNEEQKRLLDNAIENGYEPTEEDLKNNSFLGTIDKLFIMTLPTHPEYIKYYKGTSKEIFSLALDSGYKPNMEDLNNYSSLGNSEEIIRILIDKDVNVIKKYLGFNYELHKLAIEKGYKVNIKDYNEIFNFKSNDYITELLLDIDVNIIEKYTGTNEYEMFRKALQKGYNPNHSEKIYTDSNIVNAIVEFFPEYIEKNKEYYDLFVYATAIKYGYELTEEEIKSNEKYNTDSGIMCEIVKKHPEYIKYYQGYSSKPYEIAAQNSYEFSEEEIKDNYKIHSDVNTMIAIVKKHPEYMKYFNDYSIKKNEEFYIKLMELNIIPTEEFIKNTTGLNTNYAIMLALININPDYVKYYSISDKELEINKIAIEKGYMPEPKNIKYSVKNNLELMRYLSEKDQKYIEYAQYNVKVALNILLNDYLPTMDEVKTNYVINRNDEIIEKLINVDKNYIKNYFGENIELYKKAFELGYIPTIEETKDKIHILENDELMEIYIKYIPNIIEYYRGYNINVFRYAMKCGYEVEEFNRDCNYTTRNKEILNLINNNDYSILKNITINDSYFIKDLYMVAINDGYNPSIDEIIRNELYRSISREKLYEIINKSKVNECINLIFDVNDFDIEDKEYILKSKNINIPEEYEYLLKVYTLDRYKFIKNIDKFEYFLNEANIDKNDFIQYAFAKKYDWLNDMIVILNNNELETFINIKEFFFSNYYNKDSLNKVVSIDNFINILMNYSRYKELCIDIVNNNKLEKEIIDKIEFIFNRNDTFDNETKPKKYEDIKNVENLFKNKYNVMLENVENKSVEEIKNIICNLLFNEDLKAVKENLDTYGNTKDLRQLIFNNRNNKELAVYISEMMIYTSMMESIIEENDKDYLIEIAHNILNNFELSSYCSMLFSNFDNKMRKLYEVELKENLTNLNDVIVPEQLLDKEATDQYGVEVYDLSNKDYCLLAHVKSRSESIEELINGISSGNKNFISLSAISYRNQVYYSYNENNIIFGYDDTPIGNFRMSSVDNMGSNGNIQNNNTELTYDIHRTQRGILEVSNAPKGYNSEILMFREGLKPKYIILPKDKIPTEEEIEIAKKYGLKFVKTQKVKKEIKNPDHIEYKDKNNEDKKIEIDSLKELKEKINATKKEKRRKIAIFTDSHGLFEPTLAILEDARIQGITEIYSLGDNVGTGPNPKEVLELLDEYNVKSIKGNHESYALDGVDVYKEHLTSKNAYEEAEKNSSWTRSQLTQEQLEKIKAYPDEYIIEIGGEKVMLTHYLNDINTGEEKDIPEDVKMIFQGHIHFKDDASESKTLRGAGIGYDPENNEYKASYIILTEKQEGGFDITEKEIDFDYMHTYHDINLSNMNESDKEKIERWVGFKK